MVDREQKEKELLANIKAKLPELENLLEEICDQGSYENRIYRFYHQSFKVYEMQYVTRQIVKALKAITPKGQTFSPMFEEIIKAGAGDKRWKYTHNKKWTQNTRVFLEAFFHAKYFLEMAVKYGKELKEPPQPMPYGWAALLCLYI